MIKNGLLTAVFLLLGSLTLQAQKWTFGVESSGKELRGAIENYDEGKYSSSLKKLEKIHKNDTNYPQALYQRILTHTALKDFDNGVKVAEEAIELDNDFKNDYYRVLGALYTKKEDGKKALEVLDTAIKMYPRDYKLVYEKVLALNGMERYTDGINLAKVLINSNPEYPDPHFLLGRLCAEQGLFTQSIMSLTTYLILNPLSIYDAPNKGPGTYKALNLLNNVSSNSVDFDEPEEEKEKEKLKRRDLSFMNEGYEEMDNIVENQVNITKKYKTKSKIQFNLVKQVHYVINNRKGAQTEGFWADFYGPYFDKIIEEKTYSDLMMLICAVGNDASFNNKYEKDILAFFKKNSDDWGVMHGEIDITIDGKTESKMHHFGGSKLNGIGDMENDNPSGDWIYFHDNGNVSARGTWNSTGERNGKWIWYHPNGKVEEENVFEDGKLNGPFASYRELGTKSYSTSFKNDEVDATREYFEIPGYKYASNETNDNNKEGMLQYFYPNGQLSYEVKMKDGEMEGELKTYFANGALKLEQNYVEGKLDGSSKSYTIFGVLVEEADYKDGKKEGTTIEYYDNGVRKQEKEYKDGKTISRKEYYRNGVLERDLKYEDGLLSGLLEVNDEDGKPYFNIKYKEGDPQMYKYFDKNGEVIKSGKLKKRELEYNGVYPTGEKKVSGSFEDGEKDGTWKFYARGGWLESEEKFQKGSLNGLIKTYYPNGEINTSTNYSYGSKSGKFESYYSNGKMYAEGYYYYGDKEGEWRYYEINGKITSLLYYKNGEMDGKQHYFTNTGKKYEEDIRKEDFILSIQLYDSSETKTDLYDILNDGKEVRTYSNGKSSKESNYLNCFQSGDLKWFYPDGSLEVKGQYNNNGRIGEWLTYYPDGTLSRKKYYLESDKDSVWEYYHPNGKLERKMVHKFGIEDGNREHYYSNGKLKSRIPYVSGDRHGKADYFNAEGILAYSKLYIMDDFIAFIHPNGDTSKMVSGDQEHVFLSKEGVKTAVIYTKNGMYHGSLKMFYTNGKTQKDYNYVEGYLDGNILDYFTNGKLEEESNYTYGDLNGVYKAYHPNGKLRESASFIYDDYYGDRVIYDLKGFAVKHLIYYNDLVIGEK